MLGIGVFKEHDLDLGAVARLLVEVGGDLRQSRDRGRIAAERDRVAAEARVAFDLNTAVFGELENTGSDDLLVVSVETDAAESAELHEMVDDGSGTMTMREKDGGFPLPADDHLHLEPGGNHVMLLGLTAPLLAGDEVAVTFTFDDGSTFEAVVPVKDYDGANESYDDGEHEAH